MPTTTVAAVQAAYVLMDQQATLAKAIDLIRQAAAQGATIIVLPEAFIPGTPIWIDTVPIWDGDDEWYALLVDQAVVVPGPVTEALGEVAGELGVYVVVGVEERDPHGGTIYNTDALRRTGRAPAGQAPQADAHRVGADRLGHGGRLDACRSSTRRSAGCPG